MDMPQGRTMELDATLRYLRWLQPSLTEEEAVVVEKIIRNLERGDHWMLNALEAMKHG